MFKRVSLLLMAAALIAIPRLALAGNLEAQIRLMHNDMRLIESPNILMIKHNCDNLHPFLRIEKLRKEILLRNNQKEQYLEQLADLKKNFSKLGVNDGALEMFAEMEKIIRTQEQKAYSLALDVNFDGIIETGIWPSAEILELADDGSLRSVRTPDRHVWKRETGFTTRAMNYLSLSKSILMPVFSKYEFLLQGKVQLPSSSHYVSNFKIMHYPEIHEMLNFQIDSVIVEPLEDGNLKVTLRRFMGKNQSDDIVMETHFKW